MNSIWTDLLFLHGHLVRKEDLVWRHDANAENDGDEVATNKAEPSPPRAAAPDCRRLLWPRLSAPR